MPSIAEQLKDLTINKQITSNGINWADILKNEINRLKQYIQNELDIAYMSYSPKVYHRTGLFKRSLFVDDTVNINASGKQLTMHIKFNDYAWHNSLWNGYSGYLPILWSEGWAWKDQSNPIERFTYWDGNGFLQTAIDKYNQDNPYGIVVKIEKY